MKQWKSFEMLSVMIIAIMISAALIACERNDPAPQTQNNPTEAVSNDGDEEVEVTSVRILDPSLKFAEGEDINNNIWTKSLLEEYGIKVNYKWTAPSDQFAEKRALMLSTGEIPDFMALDSTGYEQAVKSGILGDLTDAYHKYASEELKERMGIDPNALTAGTVDGKLYALPQASDALTNDIMMLWIRQDWLDNLGLKAPQTVDEMIAVAEAFKNNDPDGNGNDDTLGLGFNTNPDSISYKGLLYAMGGYIDIWQKDDTGNLVFGSIQPQVKEGLGKVQEMYSKGLLDQEFYLKTAANYSEDLNSGRIGMTIDSYIAPLNFNGSWDADKKANWVCYPLPGATAEDTQAMSGVGNAYSTYWVVRKDCKNPEALIKILNHFVDKQTNDNSYIIDSEGRVIWEYSPATMNTPNNNLINQRLISEALDKGTSDGLPAQAVQNYNNIINMQNGSTDPIDYALTLIFGKESGLSAIDEYYIKPHKYMQSEFYGAPTGTMVESMATLQSMECEAFVNIVLGDSVDKFDEFVKNWKTMGGDQITEEVNAWYDEKE